jgi:hypothetical protein
MISISDHRKGKHLTIERHSWLSWDRILDHWQSFTFSCAVGFIYLPDINFQLKGENFTNVHTITIKSCDDTIAHVFCVAYSNGPSFWLDCFDYTWSSLTISVFSPTLTRMILLVVLFCISNIFFAQSLKFNFVSDHLSRTSCIDSTFKICYKYSKSSKVFSLPYSKETKNLVNNSSSIVSDYVNLILTLPVLSLIIPYLLNGVVDTSTTTIQRQYFILALLIFKRVYLYATGYLTLKIASRRSFLDENNQPFGSVSTAYQNTKIITNNLHL